MHRILRTGLVLVIALALTALAPLAQGAGETYHRIFGYPDGKDGLAVWWDSCPNQTPAMDSPGEFKIIDGEPAPYGPHGVGWDPAETGAGIAVSAYMARPTRMRLFTVNVLPMEFTSTGFATIALYPGDGTVWVGDAEVTALGDWTTIDATNLTYQWTLYRDGQFVRFAGANTLSSFAAGVGDGDGGRFGVHFGCDGHEFYVDGLRVGESSSTYDTYDLDGYKPTVTLRPKDSVSRCQLSSVRFPRPVRLTAKVAPAGPWQLYTVDDEYYLDKQVGGGRSRSANPFTVTVKPKANTRYAILRSLTDEHEAWPSQAVDVPAVPKVHLTVPKKVVLVGQQMVVNGQFSPQVSMSYKVLASYWTGRRWTPLHKVGGGRSEPKHGRFTVKVKARSTGENRIYILADGTRTLTGAMSREPAKVAVRKPVQHHAPPPPPAPNPGTSDPDPTPTPPPPPIEPPDPHHRAVTAGGGYGACGWKVGSHAHRVVPMRPAERRVDLDSTSTFPLTTALRASRSSAVRVP